MSSKNEMTAYIMAADQSPSNAKNVIWVNFLGRETAFLHGPEKYAIRYNYPVIFCGYSTDQKRILYSLNCHCSLIILPNLKPGKSPVAMPVNLRKLF